MPIHNVVYGGSLAREIAGRAPHSARATAHKKGWVHEVPHSSLSGYSPRVLAGVYTASPQPPPDAAARHMWAGVGSPQPPATPRPTDEELARHSQRRPATAKARRKVPLRQLRWLRFGAGLSPEAPHGLPGSRGGTGCSYLLHPLHPLHALHALHALRQRSTFQPTGSARPTTRPCCSAQGSRPQGRCQGRRSP